MLEPLILKAVQRLDVLGAERPKRLQGLHNFLKPLTRVAFFSPPEDVLSALPAESDRDSEIHILVKRSRLTLRELHNILDRTAKKALNFSESGDKIKQTLKSLKSETGSKVPQKSDAATKPLSKTLLSIDQFAELFFFTTNDKTTQEITQNLVKCGFLEFNENNTLKKYNLMAYTVLKKIAGEALSEVTPFLKSPSVFDKNCKTAQTSRMTTRKRRTISHVSGFSRGKKIKIFSESKLSSSSEPESDYNSDENEDAKEKKRILKEYNTQHKGFSSSYYKTPYGLDTGIMPEARQALLHIHKIPKSSLPQTYADLQEFLQPFTTLNHMLDHDAVARIMDIAKDCTSCKNRHIRGKRNSLGNVRSVERRHDGYERGCPGHENDIVLHIPDRQLVENIKICGGLFSDEEKQPTSLRSTTTNKGPKMRRGIHRLKKRPPVRNESKLRHSMTQVINKAMADVIKKARTRNSTLALQLDVTAAKERVWTWLKSSKAVIHSDSPDQLISDEVPTMLTLMKKILQLCTDFGEVTTEAIVQGLVKEGYLDIQGDQVCYPSTADNKSPEAPGLNLNARQSVQYMQKLREICMGVEYSVYRKRLLDSRSGPSDIISLMSFKKFKHTGFD